jgi:hypothetical protein
MEELKPIGFFPSNDANQTMTSYFGNVVLFDVVELESKNMSTTTSAAALRSVRSSPLLWFVGANVQEAVTSRLESSDSRIGRWSELSWILGKE